MMKRIFACILWIAVCLCTFFESAAVCYAQENGTTEVKKLYARSAVLMDADSGRVLFEKNGDDILPMASTTKIMTCILALEHGDLADTVEVSEYAASMPDVQLNIRMGETYYLKDLLYSMMLESHNDSAVAIAEHIGGSVEAFAEMMNQKAAEIGCKNTCFITPNGLDAQVSIQNAEEKNTTHIHSTTAKDLALIMSYCIKKSPRKDVFLEITRTPSYSFSDIKNTRSFSCNNHNAFLQMMEGALTGKTGFTGKAGYCYVGALERDGKTFVAALLACGWPNHKTYKWSDMRELMDYGLSNYHKADLSAEPLDDAWCAKIPVVNAKTGHLFEDAAAEVCLEDAKEVHSLLLKNDEKISVTCTVKKVLEAPIEENTVVGSVLYSIDGDVIWERKIRTKKSFEEKNYIWYLKRICDTYLDINLKNSL